jgi:hypothetical protein
MYVRLGRKRVQMTVFLVFFYLYSPRNQNESCVFGVLKQIICVMMTRYRSHLFLLFSCALFLVEMEETDNRCIQMFLD